MKGSIHSAFLGLASGISVLAYLFPYFNLPGIWWRAIPSTIVILLTGAVTQGEGALVFFGLRMPLRELLLSVSLFIVGLCASRYLILPVVTGETLTASLNNHPLGYVHQFFQALNDEMMLRAACLTLILRILPYPKTVVLATAALSSVGHHLVYRMNGVAIDWPAMLSLFSFGTIANLLFVRFGHIGYGVALHYAWNFFRFSATFVLDGHPLSEGVTFNYVEGNPWVVAGSVVALALTSIALVRGVGPRSTGSRLASTNASQHQHASD